MCVCVCLCAAGRVWSDGAGESGQWHGEEEAHPGQLPGAVEGGPRQPAPG